MDNIYNVLRLQDDLLTAGQPSEAELQQIAHHGFEVVINLGLANADYALPDEHSLVTSLAMDYVHIPVQWESPTSENLFAFFQAMEDHKNKKIFVHCAANMRVSVFVALFRINKLGWDVQAALHDVARIWQPDVLWQDFFQQHCKTSTAKPKL